MADSRVSCLSPFVSHVSVLVLLCFTGAEASDCHRQAVIHRNVGEDVELSCFQGEKLFEATWEYNGSTVVYYIENNTHYFEPFKGRVYLNPTNYSLTVKNLKLNESGEFRLISTRVDQKQLPTVFFTLLVHEVLTAPPVLTSTSTRNTPNSSCTVVLECSSKAVRRVSYRWSMRNRTTTGANLTYVLGGEDGDTVFTCTVNNSASEVSASKVLTCSHKNQEGGEEANQTEVFVMAAVISACVVIVAAGTALLVCRRRRQKAPEPLMDQTEYTSVYYVAPQSEWKSCPLYDSTGPREKAVTIYNEIQLRNLREPETSDRITA